MGEWKFFSKRQGERIGLEIKRHLLSTKTRFQKLDILETVPYGLALFLDDKIQSSQLDEFVYHEALAHPALVAHPDPQRVLVVGSAEGALLREILKHNTVQRVLMVDIDQEVVEACQQYLEAWHQGAFNDPRVSLLYADARAYLEGTEETFDCIMVDVTDPLQGGPSYRLFTQEFYRLALAHLTSQGIIAVQAESADLGTLDGHLAIANTLSSVFPRASRYQAHVPSFGESWGFALGSRGLDPSSLSPQAIDETLDRRACRDLRFYDGPCHLRLFASPKYLRAALPSRQIITDAQPLYVT
jgi:spermidine synthase